MSLFPLRVLGAFPSLDTYQEIIEEFAELGSGTVCVLESGLNNCVRELIAPYPSLSISTPAEISGTQLALSNQSSHPIADSKQVAEFVRSVMRSAENLGPLEPVRGLSGVQRRMHSALNELRQWRIGPDQLRKHDGRLDSVSVEKFAAIAFVEELIGQSLSIAHLDLEETKLERIMRTKLSSQLAPSRILVFAGGHLAPIQIDWLQWSRDNGSVVWIVTPFDSKLPNSWTGSQNLAASCNSPIEAIGNLPALVADFCRLTKEPSSKVEVRIESAADEMAECEWALRRVQNDLMSGLRHAQIGIFVRDLRSYAPLLSAAAQRLDVPLRLPIIVDLMTSQFAIWVLSLVRSMTSPSLRAILDAIASPFSNLSVEEESSIKGVILDSLRVRGGEWNRLNQQTENMPLWIQTMLAWQSNAIGRESSRKEWNGALAELFQLEPIKHIAELQSPERNRDQIALEEMRKSFERHVFADLDTEALSFREFVNELEDVWQMATIDIGAHSVGVEVSDSPLELLGKHSIHALGLLEGMFPRRRSEDPILSDWERSVLIDTSSPRALLNSHTIAAQESELFLTLLGAAKFNLTLSFPATSEDRDNIPAFYLSELSDAVGENVLKSHHLQGVWAPEAEKCHCEADKRLRDAVNLPMLPHNNEIVESESSLIALRTIPGDRHTIFDLRNASGCGFRFGAQRSLHLKPNVGERRLRRLPKTELLPQFLDSETAQKELLAAWNQKLDEVESEVSPDLVAMASAAAKRNIKNIVDSEFSSRGLWPKQAGQTEFNVDLESDDLIGEIKLSAEDKLLLSGRIPAVSKLGPYRVAHVFHARKALFEGVEKWGDEERIEVGLYFAALGNKSAGTAIEFCSEDGERLLVCNEIIPGSQPRSLPKDGLKTLSVNARETKFLAQAGEIVRRAVSNSRNNSMAVSPGDQCTFCDFGELCRRSHEFGEQSDLMEENE